MATWSKNNVAHRRVYIVLKMLGQNHNNFKDTGKIKMNQLAYWNPGDSTTHKKTKAMSLATQLSSFFIMVQGAVLEENKDTITSVEAMTDVLIVNNNTVNQLADVADEFYLFDGESQDVE